MPTRTLQFSKRSRPLDHYSTHNKTRSSRWYSSLTALGIALLSGVLNATPAKSAEEIVISYGPAELYVSIAELNRFATQGEVTPILALYGTILGLEDGTRLRQILQSPLEASPLSIEQFTETPSGQIILTRAGKVLKTDQGENGYSALKTALNQALKRPEGLTILNLLQEFPGQSIRVDLDFSVELVEDLLQILVEDESILEWVEQQALVLGNNRKINFNLPDLRQSGTVQWTESELSFRNPNRERSSPFYVYLPQVETPAPLVIISHGLGSDPKTFSYIAEHLASYGFAVALPEHIDTSANTFNRFFEGFERPPEPSVFENRPLDITYLLNELEQISQSDPTWKDRIDFSKIGVMGQSFGGYTALAVGGAKLNPEKLQSGCFEATDRRVTLNISTLLQCRSIEIAVERNNFRDPRIKAILAINPLASLIFGEEGMSQIQVPLMMIAGTKDYVTPAVPEQIYPYTWLTTPQKYLVLLQPGTHFSLLRERPGRVAVPPQVIGPDPNFAYPYLRALSLIFFQAYLQNESDYFPYLSQSYLNTINTDLFQMSLIEVLTLDEIQQILEN